MARSDVTPGSTVGTYSVQGKLGGTAWADTFVASRPGERLVALKVVDAIDDTTWAAIERTKKLLESVPEHLVLPMIDVGADADSGVRFIATPLSDYPSLSDLVEIYALSPPEAIALVKNLAIAIDDAQAACVPHLALKPSNVFVGPPPTYAVRVVDFGADALRRANTERGALSWLAPEQIDRDDAADARADVFVVALLAFFAMTGKPYWAAVADDEDALVAEIRGPRVAPSERARAIGAHVPAKLDRVLLRALGSLDERFESARAFADALEAALAEPEPAAPTEQARSSERHIKATLKLEKFRMPTLENRAPSGTQPLEQRTQKLAPARIPEPKPPPPPVAPAAAPPPLPAAAPRHAKRTIYIPQRVLLVLVVAVTLLTVGVTVAALRKMRTTAPPAPTTNAPPSTAAPPGPPTAIVVPEPPSDEPAAEPPSLAANESEIEIVCTPACDKVLIDGKPMTTYPEPMRVPPGRHGVGVSLKGYGGQFRTVLLKGGERQTLSFTLSVAAKK